MRTQKMAMNKIQARFNKFKQIFLRELLQYFMARKIQRHFRLYLKKIQNGHTASLRPLQISYLKGMFKLLNQVMDRKPMDRSKVIVYDFCTSHLGSKQLILKLKKFYFLAERLKRRFLETVHRRKHKFRVMSEYWTCISDTCYFLKKSKNSAIIKSFNGHKFYKITD